MKLSIVIPVYNMEKYVKRCLDSVISQNIVPKDDYEIIVVNDGSTDSSQSILDSYNWNGLNYQLVQKVNGGLSDARNVGFSYVNGEYTWFIDSDDWIEENCLKDIFPLLNNIDVLHFSSYYCDYDDNSKIVNYKVSAHTGRDLTTSKYLYPVQFSIYRTNYLKENNLSFKLNILMEDLHFTPRALYMAKTVVVVDFPVYHYYQREGSIMKSKVSSKRIKDRIWISHDLYKFMEEYVHLQDKCKWSECIVTDINAIMFDANRSGDDRHLKIVRQYINKEKHLTQLLQHSNNFRNRIWYYLSILFCGDFYHVYIFLYILRYRTC